MLDTPILFLIFNRPEATAKVFAEIVKSRPAKLFIAADGPREDRPDDTIKTAKCREIVSQINWPCEVKTLFREKNLGCKKAVSSAIDWFFANVEEGIILEDDCLPNQDFFTFCQTMLEKYRTNEKIMAITGTNSLGLWKEREQSYHFSIYGGVWGWASWRRAWQHYDVEMKLWNEPAEKEKIGATINNSDQFAFRKNRFDRTAAGKINTWDYQWSFARLKQNGLSIVPAKNLITNIGLSDGTHENDQKPVARFDLTPPYISPTLADADRDFDQKVFAKLYQASFIAKMFAKIKSWSQH